MCQAFENPLRSSSASKLTASLPCRTLATTWPQPAGSGSATRSCSGIDRPLKRPRAPRLLLKPHRPASWGQSPPSSLPTYSAPCVWLCNMCSSSRQDTEQCCKALFTTARLCLPCHVQVQSCGKMRSLSGTAPHNAERVTALTQLLLSLPLACDKGRAALHERCESSPVSNDTGAPVRQPAGHAAQSLP